jgi:TPR repeat protein
MIVKHRLNEVQTGEGFNLTGVNNMEWSKLETFAKLQPADQSDESLQVAQCLAAAATGDIVAYYDLGIAFSTGSHGATCDLVEAHKWFNLAAVGGHEEAAWCRADISEEMTAREIAEAQRRAREWLSAGQRRAA